MPLTITEALAEIKTIEKRIAKKHQYLTSFLTRQDGFKDPLASDGGSFNVVGRERQAITDLEQRVIALRRGIALANQQTAVTVSGHTRSIAEWLVWRRDVAPGAQSRLQNIRQTIHQAREQARRGGLNVVPAGGQAEKPSDILVNINEAQLAAEIEFIETALGELDGQFSLKNATIPIVEGFEG